jgi:hypothetical protein
MISGLQVRIPAPGLHLVRGKVIGDLPEQSAHISVMFARDIGALEPVGASGPDVRADGTFEYTVLPGRYSVEVCEFSPAEPDGRIRMFRPFGKATINVAEADLNGVEIHVSSENLAQ